MPSKVTFSDGSTITYSYAADRTKLRTVHTISGTTTQKDYCSNVVYENGVQKMLLTEEGYVDLTANTSTYYYYLKDHQGNNRVVIKDDGTVQETNHYYPFGGVFASTGNVQPYNYCANNPVKFIDPNGKGIETAWDIFNIILGAKSFGDNISAGNYGAAVADGVGVVLDVGAALLPFIPGGVSSGIKAARVAEKAVDSAKSVDRAADTMKTTNKNARFIVESNGNIVDTNATPKGAYIQLDGSRTDVLQDKAHYKKVGGGNVENHGRTHTHELETNTNPQTGVGYTRISNNNTHIPTYEEMKNIENGVARKIK